MNKQETLEEAAEKYADNQSDTSMRQDPLEFSKSGEELWEEAKEDFKAGAKWQQERSYSEEDMKNAFDSAREFNSLDGIVDVHIVLPMGGDMSDLQPLHFTFEEWFEQFKKK